MPVQPNSTTTSLATALLPPSAAARMSLSTQTALPHIGIDRLAKGQQVKLETATEPRSGQPVDGSLAAASPIAVVAKEQANFRYD